MRRLALLIIIAMVACTDPPTNERSGPAIIRLDLKRSNQVATSAAVDVAIAYARTGAANKEFFTSRVNLATATQQVSLTVDLAECLADAAHVGGGGVCTLHVTVSLLDAESAVLDRQTIGPLTAEPGRLATQNDVALFAPSQSLSVGSSHACVLKMRQAYCWGANSAGQLGDGTLTSRFSAVPVTGGFQFVALATGFEATCGLTPDGIVACWGFNIFGEVGDGTLIRNRATPAAVVGGRKFTSVAAGAGFTCALTQAGAPYCWGFNFYGQLGDGTTTTRTEPTAVSASPALASLALGSDHSCGLTSTGVAYCWGSNTNGAIGDGTSTDRFAPTPVLGGLTFKSITSGYSHTCGLTNVGVAHCWGLNANGELGDGTTTTRLAPTPVSGGRTFTKLAAAKNGNGEGSTCGIVTDGTVYCWGSNRIGQLGDGTIINKSVPTPIAGGRRFTTLDNDNGGACALATDGSPWCWGRSPITTNSTYIRTTPTAVTGLQNATSVSAGGNYACAIVSGGGASCWGDNFSGTLGDGSSTPRNTPQTVVAGGVAYASISASTVHTCALSVAGAAYCWGSNSSGQLGNGTSGNSAIVPAPVSGGLTFASIGASGSGSGFTCGLTTVQTAFCWGTNLNGTLGDGTTTQRNSPVAVAGGRTYIELKVGGSFACGRVPTGAVFCWGFNGQGQLGNGSPSALTYETIPVNVVGVPFSTIAAGGSHACGTAPTGVSYCWGSNAFGQLGNGTSGSNQNLSPIPVSGFSFSSFAAGSNHTCALTVAGKAYCWGFNSAGQLGDGTEVSSSVPVAVAGNHVFTSLSAGTNLTCGREQTGAVFCWGDAYRGQIGDGTFGYSLVPVQIPIAN